MNISTKNKSRKWIAGYVIICAVGITLGFPNQKFFESNGGQIINLFHDIGYAITLLLTLAACTVWTILWRNFTVANKHNLSLEMKVIERTKELEVLAQTAQQNLQAAEEANLAKGNFLANMSHELRTPMNSVLGMSYLLAQTSLNEEQYQLVSAINHSGESLLLLLNDILDFSKIEAGALQLEDIAFNLKDVLTKTFELMKPMAEQKGLEFIFEYDDELPEYVWGDPSRLRQVITNMLSNAIKFTKQGHVKLALASEKSEQSHMMHISVEDTGVGIAQSKLGYIFDKFTQADESITRLYGGTGLGLAISKHLVELMKGNIDVSSIEGEGSIFTLNLPLRAAEQSSVIVDSEVIASIQQNKVLVPIEHARILIAEDYHINAIFAEKLLRKFGAQNIDFAQDGLEAIKRCQENSYDIILMDCQMPELDGYRATEELRHMQLHSGDYTPVVAMTANAMVGDREKCLRAGMDDYVSKPIRVQHLKKVLQKWFKFPLEDSKAQDEAIEKQPAPIDLTQIDAFTNGNPGERQELFDLFVNQTEELITKMEQNTTEDLCEEWRSLAHRLKGSSGNLGATTLHDLSARAEKHFTDDKHNKLECLTVLKSEFDRLKDYMQSVA